MARILLLYFGLWILSLYYVAFAKGQSCLFKEDESQAEHLCIKVKCEKKDSVIADIQLFAGKTDNEKVKISELDLKCTGETAEFIYQSKKCFWKSECTIQYPRGPMITSRMGEPISFIKAHEGHETASETKCINKNADVACIIEAKCVRKKNIIDIEDYIRKSKTKIKRKTGIIRSHRLYPWFYDNNKMDKISGYSLTFAKPKELKVGFHDLDIYEGDVITMVTNKNTVKFNGTKNDMVVFMTMELPPMILVPVIASLLPTWVLCGDYTLGMDSETSCTKTHYYKKGDVFTASANGMVHGGRCPLTFIQSGMWGDNSVEPCLSLCVKIVSYTMESCNVKMAYHDGVNDYTPVMFDCHTFPPVMWCSSTNDLKVTVSESKNYRGKDYAITLEVKPFCGSLDLKTTDASVVAVPNEEPKIMNKTALIVGAIVGTVSIIFVLGWILYCYKKRQSEEDAVPSDRYQQDRRYRSTTPNQQSHRYAPVGFHVPASSQSSSDQGAMDPYLSHKEIIHPGVPAEVKRPYHDMVQPQLSNHGHVTGNDPRYQMSPMSQGVPEKGPSPMQLQQPQNQSSQYMLQNKIYNYPQFNTADNTPSDTRYVVYDFDYPAPVQRKYSGGKIGMGQLRDSPVKDINRIQGRELTPSREFSRPMPPIESTTTDHTSDNDDSSYSVTTEDETTTDDQMSPVKGHVYNIAPPFGYGAVPNRDGNVHFYNHSNFQPVQRNMNPVIRDDRVNVSTPIIDQSGASSCDQHVYSDNMNSKPLHSKMAEPKEGPQPQVPGPQVPSVPRNTERSNPVLQHEELPWPHNPPPAYTQTDSGDSDDAQII